MKSLVIILAFAASLFGQAGTTTIVGPVHLPNGTAIVNGTAYIRLMSTCTAPGNYIIRPAGITAPIVNGAFNPALALVPNDTCLPAGTKYQVTYPLSGQLNTPAEYWTVPTSGSAVTVASIRSITPPPAPSVGVGISALTGCTSKGGLIVGNGTSPACLAASTTGFFLRYNSAAANGIDAVAIPGGGDALTANPLSQFAATTSAQLAGVLSDETGSGSAVFANAPTVSGPVLGNLAEATCDSSLRGKIAFVQGGVGVADTARICSKDANENFQWRPIL